MIQNNFRFSVFVKKTWHENGVFISAFSRPCLDIPIAKSGAKSVAVAVAFLRDAVFCVFI